jgi:hypothetical protein
MVRHGVIASEDLQLFEFVDDPRAALKVLQARVVLEPLAPKEPQFAKSRCPPQA